RKGKLSIHAANEIQAVPQGKEREDLKKKVAAVAGKKEAKRIVGESKVKNKGKKQSQQLGSLKMPGLTGVYSTLVAVLENLPKLANELRNLENAPHRLSIDHARELKAHITGLKALDAKDLLAAADVALLELDRIIANGKKPESEPVDAVDDVG